MVGLAWILAELFGIAMALLLLKVETPTTRVMELLLLNQVTLTTSMMEVVLLNLEILCFTMGVEKMRMLGKIFILLAMVSLAGCYAYNKYPKGPHKEKVIKVTGVVDRQVEVKYE